MSSISTRDYVSLEDCYIQKKKYGKIIKNNTSNSNTFDRSCTLSTMYSNGESRSHSNCKQNTTTNDFSYLDRSQILSNMYGFKR